MPAVIIVVIAMFAVGLLANLIKLGNGSRKTDEEALVLGLSSVISTAMICWLLVVFL